MRVSEAMTRDVKTATPEQTIRDAARMMADIDAGALPVHEGDHLVGMITDRDIAIRGVAEGKGPDTSVGDVMTRDVKYCYEDEDLEHIVQNMGDIQVKRLPVVNRDKRLVGIISLGDIAVTGGAEAAGKAEEGIARPGGQHSQTGGKQTGGKGS